MSEGPNTANTVPQPTKVMIRAQNLPIRDDHVFKNLNKRYNFINFSMSFVLTFILMELKKDIQKVVCQNFIDRLYC